MSGFQRGRGNVIEQKVRDKIVMLKNRHGLDYATIAERLGINRSTVCVIYNEERKKMENSSDQSNRQAKTMG